MTASPTIKRLAAIAALLVLVACSRVPPPKAAGADTPILKGLASDLGIEVIGVYEGGGLRTQNVQTSSGLRTARAVTVDIGRTDHPLALVLSSYEPVIWELAVPKDARLDHVLVSGYYESLVHGAHGALVTRIGGAYTYSLGDAGYKRLQEEIFRYTGRGVDGFQGAYRGVRFSVAGRAPHEIGKRAQLPGPRPTMSLPRITSADEPSVDHWHGDVAAFAHELYEISAYTWEGTTLDDLVDAELELVASRWLARKIASAGGRPPARAPGTWDRMLSQLRDAVRPVAESHLILRTRAAEASQLQGSVPFEREYARLINESKGDRGLQFNSVEPAVAETPQTDDIPEILAFHETQAAKKWRVLWPQLRGEAARLMALQYRVDADPALASASANWNERAKMLLKGRGRIIAPNEWQSMTGNRLYFTLSGLDRFVLPLGTEMSTTAANGNLTTVDGMGRSIVITSREGNGLAFRLLDARWDELAGRLSASELQQIDDALTASWAQKKGRWFAPLELEWDAYLSVSRQLRGAPRMREVYKSFARQSNAAMERVWTTWQRR